MIVEDKIIKVRQRIGLAGGDLDKVILVAVTKGRDISAVKEALAAGIRDIGENRVQEAVEKHRQLMGLRPEIGGARWHMIGRLQTNKAKEAVKIFDLIQSVDSLRLAQELDKQAARIDKIQDVLIEIKTSPEAGKTGIKPEEAPQVIAAISKLKNIRVNGLMTIAPPVDNPESARPYFRQLRELRDRIKVLPTTTDLRPTTNPSFQILSMGMTDDFEAAVREGATMVRIGRAIFD